MDKHPSASTHMVATHLPGFHVLEAIHPLLQGVFALTSGQFIDRLFHLQDNKELCQLEFAGTLPDLLSAALTSFFLCFS